MKRGLPAYCYADKAGRIYFQRRGFASARIHAAPGTAEFAIEYAKILNGVRPIPPGKTFHALLISYKKSPRFQRLAPRTKADYQKVIEWVNDTIGTISVASMRRKDVIRARDANPGRFGNYIVQVLRILLGHAHDLGWVDDNAASGVSLAEIDGIDRRPWPGDLVTKFRATATGRALLIFELCVGTGQRIGDVLKMRWDEIDNGGVLVSQGKTGRRLWIPLTPTLRATLETTQKAGLTICAQANGRPTSYRGAADLIMAVRRKIGAEEYDIHALRYTTTAELAALGCSDDLIMAVTGHSTKNMVAHYAGEVRQITRAKEAQGRRE